MAGFYGNINNINKSTFQFDKIYPSREAMEEGCSTDGVFVGRYVLVKYDTSNLSDNLPDSVSTHPNYREQGYDGTVWQKVYGNASDSTEYILIADLNSTPPTISVETVAPGTELSSINTGQSNAMHYTIMIPASWRFDLGTVDYNEEKFNEEIHYNSTNTIEEDSIVLNAVSNTTNFPKQDEENRLPSDENWEPTYENDTYELSINLPSIGNIISKIWDIIYGITDEDVLENGQPIGKARNTNNVFENKSLAGAYQDLKTYGNNLTGEFNNLTNTWSNYQKYLTGDNQIPESFDENWVGEFNELNSDLTEKFNNLENSWINYQRYLTGDDDISEETANNAFGTLKSEWGSLRNELEELKTNLERLRGSVVENSEDTLNNIENWEYNTVYKITQNGGDPSYYYRGPDSEEGTAQAVLIEIDTLWGSLIELNKVIDEKILNLVEDSWNPQMDIWRSNFNNKISEWQERFDEIVDDFEGNVAEELYEIDNDWEIDGFKGEHAVQKKTILDALNEKADLKNPSFFGIPEIKMEIPRMEEDIEGNPQPVINEETGEQEIDVIDYGRLVTDVELQDGLEGKMDKDALNFGAGIVFEEAPLVHYVSDIEYGFQDQNIPVVTERTLGPRLFIARFNSTPFQDLYDAWAENKIIVCVESNEDFSTNSVYQLFSAKSDSFKFYQCDAQGYNIITCGNTTTIDGISENGWIKISGKWNNTDNYSNCLYMIDYNTQNAGILIQNALNSGKFVVCRYTINDGETANYFGLTYANKESQTYDFRCFTGVGTTGYYYDIQYKEGAWSASYEDNQYLEKIWITPFWVTYGTTSFNEINTAYIKGRTVLCKAAISNESNASECIFYLNSCDQNEACFIALNKDKDFISLICDNTDTWTRNTSKLSGGDTSITIDSTLSSTSTNPVRNSVITTALNSKAASVHSHDPATTSAAGFMSAADKTKLNGIATEATKTTISATTPIAASASTGAVKITHGTSGVTAGTYGTVATTALTPSFGSTFSVPGITANATGHVTAAGSHTVKIPNAAATTSAAGLMSAADKTKLDNFTQIKQYLGYTKGASNCVWLEDRTACWVYNYNKTTNLCMVTFTFKIQTPSGTISSRYIISDLPKAKMETSCILTNASGSKQLMAYISTGGNLIASADLSADTIYYGNITYLCSNPNTWYSSVIDPR